MDKKILVQINTLTLRFLLLIADFSYLKQGYV